MTSRKDQEDTPCSPSETSFEAFEKLFRAISDPKTRDFHARHLALAKNAIYKNEHGWKLAELPLVSDLLLFLRDNVLAGLNQFLDPLILALSLCNLPFVRLKTNEEISNPDLLRSLIQTLATFLSCDVVVLQLCALDSLHQIAIGACLTRTASTSSEASSAVNHKAKKKQPTNSAESSQHAHDLRLPTRVFAQNLIQESGVLEAIVTVFHELFAEDQEQQNLEQDAENPLESDSHVFSATQIEASASVRSSARHAEEDSKSHAAEQTTEEADSDSDLESDRQASNQTSKVKQQLTHAQERLQLVLFPLVHLVYELSSHDKTAERFVSLGGLDWICFLLDQIDNAQDELLPLCLLILWNILELNDAKMQCVTKTSSRKELIQRFRHQNATFALAKEQSLLSLSKTLELLLTQGFRKQEKELRNQCLMILELMSRRNRNVDLMADMDLTAFLLAFATCYETGNHQVSTNRHHFATTSQEDLEFKQMLWLLLGNLCVDHSINMDLAMEWRFIQVLLMYIDLKSNSTCASGVSASIGASDAGGGSDDSLGDSFKGHIAAFSRSQRRILQLTALQTLSLLVPFALDHFFQVRGPERLLQLLRRVTSLRMVAAAISPTNGGAGPGVLTDTEAKVKNCEPVDSEVVRAAWTLMVQITNAIHKQPQERQRFYQDALGELGLIELALAVFGGYQSAHNTTTKKPTSTPTKAFGSGGWDFGVRRDALWSCIRCCSNFHELNRMRFQKARGIDLICEHLVLDKSCIVLQEHLLLVVIDAVGQCVVGHDQNERKFIGNGNGIHKLLDILEVAPRILQSQVLTCLAEICINPLAIPFFQSWRSTGITGEMDDNNSNNMTTSGTQRFPKNLSATQLLLELFAQEEDTQELDLRMGRVPAKEQADQLHLELSENMDDAETQLPKHQQQITSFDSRSSVLTKAFHAICDCQSDFVVFHQDPAMNFQDSASLNGNLMPSAGTTTAMVIKQSGTGTSPGKRPTSPAFARLKEALRASASQSMYEGVLDPATKSSWMDMNLKQALDVKEESKRFSLRGKIYSVLANTAFACDDSCRDISPSPAIGAAGHLTLAAPAGTTLSLEQQFVLEMAKEFPSFQVGAMWQTMEMALFNQRIKPIYSDQLFIHRQLEQVYNLALSTKHAQRELTMAARKHTRHQQQQFVHQVLIQKQQEEQLEQFRQTSLRQNSVMKLHLDAKKTRRELLAKQKQQHKLQLEQKRQHQQMVAKQTSARIMASAATAANRRLDQTKEHADEDLVDGEEDEEDEIDLQQIEDPNQVFVFTDPPPLVP